MDLIINRRNDLTAVIEGLDDNGLTGYSGRVIITTEPGAELILNKAGVISNPLQNEVDFSILPSDLTNVVPGDYRLAVDVWKASDTNYVYNPIVSERVRLVRALGPNPAG